MEEFTKEDLREFVEEISEHLLQMEQDLLLLEDDPASVDLLDNCFRHMHSIKGACGYMGFSKAASLAHGLENVFDAMRTGSLMPSHKVFDAVFHGVDLLKKFLASLDEGGGEAFLNSGEVEAFLKELKGPLMEDQTETGQPQKQPVHLVTSQEEGQARDQDELDSELMEVFKEEITGLLKRLKDGLCAEQPQPDTINAILDEMERLSNYMGHDDVLKAVRHIKVWFQKDGEAQGGLSGEEFISLVKELLDSLPFPYEFGLEEEERMEPDTWDIDEDRELYEIFINFVREKAELLRKLPPNLDEEWIMKCQQAIEAIKASASYMDYGEVVRLLEEWEERLTEVLTESAGKDDTYSKAPLKELWPQLVRLLPELKDPAIESNGDGGIGDRIKDGSLGAVKSSRSVEMGETGHGGTGQLDAFDEIGVLIDAFKREDLLDQRGEAKKSGVLPEIEGTIRISAERVDELVVDVGELAVIRTGVSRLFEELRILYARWLERGALPPRQLKGLKDLVIRLGEHSNRLERVAKGLQDHVLDLRMVPVSQLFQRVARQVRDLSRRLKKEVELEIKGQETTLDKQVMEAVQDPLMHIIRNAMDHGIETPDERIKAKKPPKGRLLIEAYHEGNYVVIKVSDDGRGIDTEAVIKRAVEKGLVAPDDVKGRRRARALELIFLPGMTTASEVSETSGRGVGLDVVKKNIEALGGILAVGSTVGNGTSFSIKIPLTLAIIPVLLMQLGEQKIGVPMNAVEETLRVYRDQVSMAEGQEIITVRQRPVPLVRLERLFKGMAPGAQRERELLVLVRHGDIDAAISADAFLGQHDVVIKPLQEYLTEGPGFSGVATLGDGSVALILDVAAVLNRAGLWFKAPIPG